MSDSLRSYGLYARARARARVTPERLLTHCPLTLLVSWLDDVPEGTLGFLFLFNICSPGIELKHRDEDGTVVESIYLHAVWYANTHHRGRRINGGKKRETRVHGC